MKEKNDALNLETIPSMNLVSLAGLLLASVAGALAAVFVLPMALPGLAASLLGPEPKAYWYLARSSAWAAYLLLWGSMMMGLLITSKAARLWPGNPAAYDVHQFISLLGIAFALFHGLILTGDRYINFSVMQVFIPFSNPAYRPLWVGIGQIGFYTMAVAGLSFYLRRAITPRVWRLIHYLAFATFLFVLIHGITSGTDSGQFWAAGLYWLTGGSVLFLTVYRILLALIVRARLDFPSAEARGLPAAKSPARQ
jgi:predicted ferric reductase